MIQPTTPKERKRLDHDLAILIKFVDIYCRRKHTTRQRQPFQFGLFDVKSVYRGDLRLCPGCSKLLCHAITKRTHCPINPKPACKHCPEHCYHPKYRQQIRKVMAYSGRHLVLTGRVDYLLHLLF